MSESVPNKGGVEIAVRDLWKYYDGAAVLQGIDLRIEPGEIFVIMGPSGSGKTVLLKHLIGLERPDQGDVYIDGHPIEEALQIDYRLAMVFQSGALLNSLTVGENVGLYLSEHRLYPPDEIARRVAEKLEVVGLKGMEDRNPSELSGGMRKRVAIARALVIEPQLIFYDEPTSELDPISAQTIGDEIGNLKERIRLTSVVVTHDRDLAFGLADRMAIIHGGKILAVGRPEEIRASSDPELQRFLKAGFNQQNTKVTA